jgi:hypothetical protein
LKGAKKSKSYLLLFGAISLPPSLFAPTATSLPRRRCRHPLCWGLPPQPAAPSPPHACGRLAAAYGTPDRAARPTSSTTWRGGGGWQRFGACWNRAPSTELAVQTRTPFPPLHILRRRAVGTHCGERMRSFAIQPLPLGG